MSHPGDRRKGGDSVNAAGVRYTERDDGDLITGTKEQIQALGLGIGVAFPGELGGPRLELKVLDARGYPVNIWSTGDNDDSYTAYVTFPHWPARPEPIAEQWALAVQGLKKSGFTWFDEYIGSADDLAAAGLVRIDQLPGKPGMRKKRVTIFPDGTLPSGALTANHREARLPGTRWIERVSVASYRVCIVVSQDERTRRDEAWNMAQAEWLRKVRALPRPARLTASTCDATTTDSRRAHLRLVWSRPSRACVG